MKPMTMNELIEYEILHRKHLEAKEQIVNRLEHIIDVICKVFKTKTGSWYFPNAAEGEVGEIQITSSLITAPEAELNIYLETNKSLQTWNYNFNEGIPVQFLLLNDEVIERKLIEEIAETKKKEQEQAEKNRAKETAKTTSLVKRALAKLTPAERKALKL